VLQAVVALVLVLVLVLGPALAMVRANLKYEDFWPDPVAVGPSLPLNGRVFLPIFILYLSLSLREHGECLL
jgi:hypothetical protein